MPKVEDTDLLIKWMMEAGFPSVDLELRDNLLIVKLPPAEGSSLLQSRKLRLLFVERAQNLGFARVALELSSGTQEK